MGSNKLIVGVNDLETWCVKNNRLDLLKEWDYEKNSELGMTPQNVSYGSAKKVYWVCQRCGFQKPLSIKDKTLKNIKCPKCNTRGTSFSEQAILYYIKQYFSDAINRYTDLGMELDIYIPSIKTAIEYDGVAYHKNKIDVDIRKNQLCKENGITLIRIREEGLCSYDDCICIFKKVDKTYKNLNDTIKTLFTYFKTPFSNFDIRRDNVAILEQYTISILINSLATKFPEIAKEWHPTLNGNLKPENFSAHTNKQVWWLCPICGHEWLTSPNARVRGRGCPKCANQLVAKAKFKRVQCIETGEIFDSIKDAEKFKNNGKKSHIGDCCLGMRTTACGFHWKFIP